MKRNLLFFVILIFISTTLFAQKRAFTIDDLYKVKNVASPVVSPTGNKIAFMVSDYNLEEGKTNTDIYILYRDGAFENISGKDLNETNPFWLSDNTAFVHELF